MTSGNIARRPNGRYRARFRDESRKERTKDFARKVDAKNWLDEITTSMRTGTYVDPKTAKTTMNEWCDVWLDGYQAHRASTVRQATTHVKLIKAHFGPRLLSSVKPSDVKAWVVKLKSEGRADSYVYALHSRLSQIYSDAVHDGIVARNPCSRRTSPKSGDQRPYVATTAQIWALWSAMPDHLQAAILLGAFAGLRTGEICGLRVRDIDFMRGVVAPTVQFPSQPLKTETSRTPIPIPQSMAALLSSHVRSHQTRGEFMFRNEWLDQLSPRTLERAFRDARAKVIADEIEAKVDPGERLPGDFRLHDCRHYFASLLIAAGSDVKVVQARVRHSSAKTTLDVYGHLWPDSDDSTRVAVDAIIDARIECKSASGC